MTLTVEKIIGYTIAIVVLLFLVFGGGDAFAKSKNAANKIVSWLPDLSFGQKPLQGAKPTVPKTQHTEITNFQKKLQELMDSPKENCFVQFDGFSELPEGIVITMTNFPGKTTVKITGGAGGKQEVTDLQFDVPKMIPCVVAGDKVYTQGFYHNYLDPGDSKQNNINGNPVFNAITQPITIALDTTFINENGIDYGTGSEDFAGDHWLYKPDKNHVCFFPTVDGNGICDGDDSDGLDVACLTDETKAKSLPYRVQHDPTLLCFGEFKSAQEQSPSEPETSPAGIKRGTT